MSRYVAGKVVTIPGSTHYWNPGDAIPSELAEKWSNLKALLEDKTVLKLGDSEPVPAEVVAAAAGHPPKPAKQK